MIVPISAGRGLLLGTLLCFSASNPLAGSATFYHRGTAFIDGGDTEWSDADAEFATIMVTFPDLPFSVPVTLLLMNDDNNLYAAVRGMPDVEETDAINFLSVSSWSSDSTNRCLPGTLVNEAQVTSEWIDGTFFFDMFGSNDCGTRAFDLDDGGATNGDGEAGDVPAFMEISHPLDSTDDAHDLSAALGDAIQVELLAGRCVDAACGFGKVQRRVFLAPSGLIFYSDFEVGDPSEWDFTTPP